MMLAARDLAYGYPGHTVGRGVSFDLGAGEVLCVLGPNGEGKTTLFRTLLGLLPPHAGEVTVSGQPVAALSRQEVARALGYVPQGHAGWFPYTVAEVVLMGRSAHLPAFGSPSRHDREVAAQALALLGIDHLAGRDYTRISGGERQLALIARALAQQPALLVMDEPTANLDFGNQARVLSQVRKLAGRGVGVVFSTHHPEHAFACADRVLMLKGGHPLRLDTPQEAVTADSLRELYGVETVLADLGTAPDGRALRACVPQVLR